VCITFEGSELHTYLKNINIPADRDEFSVHLIGAKAAVRELPQSQFWKDAVKFMESKLEGKA
jgi:hypothetical protein